MRFIYRNVLRHVRGVQGVRRGVVLCALGAASCLLLVTFSRCLARQPSNALAATSKTNASPDDKARPVSSGTADSTDLPAGGSKHYEVQLLAGQFLRARIVKKDLGLRLTVFEPGGQVYAEFVSRRYGSLHVAFIARTAGTYHLEVRSLESENSGSVELRVEELRDAKRLDAECEQAVREYAEAERLRDEWRDDSLRRAAGKYALAATSFRSSGQHEEGVSALIDAGDVYFALSDYGRALDAYQRALEWSRRVKDQRGEMKALNGIGYLHIYLGENQTALRYLNEVSARYEQAAPPDADDARRIKAQMLNNFGEVYYSLSDHRKAFDFFRQAVELWSAASDRAGQALALLNLGYTYNDTGELLKAAENYGQALSLWQAVGDLRGEALCRTALGGVHALHGESQLALEHHNEAVRLFQTLGDRRGEAASYNGLGHVYENLNDLPLALDYFKRALELYRAVRNQDFEALTLSYIARLHHSLGDTARAVDSYNQSISLSQAVGDRQVEASALRGVAEVYASEKNVPQALAGFNRALKLYREIGSRRGQALVLDGIGRLHQQTGQREKALAYFNNALETFRAIGDVEGETSAIYNLALAERDNGQLDEARAHLEASVNLIESLRGKITNQDLRSSYFASVRQHHELYIDVLMQLHKKRPREGFDAAALQASEKARARALLEMLTEAGVNIRRGADPALIERERSLRQTLADKAEYQTHLLNSSHTEEQTAEVAEDLRRLTAEHREVQDRIRESSPLYTSLVQPHLLDIEEIQTSLLDDNTLLLEYALGDDRSYLWAVTPSAVNSFELPGRRAIESATQEVYELLTARQPSEGDTVRQYQMRVAEADRAYWPKALDLSRTLLGPVAGLLGTKRLLIVGDGAIEYLPFEALPLPSSSQGRDEAVDGQATPLVLDNEVVTLPSASTLAALRRQHTPKREASKTVVVLADPVFERSDPRVRPAAQSVAVSPGGAGETETALLRGFDQFSSEDGIPRLPSTLREAKAIMAVVPDGEGMLAAGFDANRATITGEELKRARIIHLATHSILNSEHPELSGVLLSLFDEQGNRRRGLLRLQDIYDMDLSADLVVLSACRTALGKNVKGEGMIGLTRGFMYAGTKGVVASLWKVDDEATAELMRHFYTAMLSDKLPPSAALKAAKVAMWKQERWRAPYYWAAFVLQGECGLPVSGGGGGPSATAIAAGVLFTLSIGAFFIFRRARVIENSKLHETEAADH